MKPFNAIKRFGAKVPAAVGAALLLAASSVHAELPAVVGTKAAEAEGNISAAGALGLGIFLAAMLFMWIRRVMR